MKKIIVFLFVSLAVMQGANAQLGIFNHLTIGANVGTPGIGADVAMPITRFLIISCSIKVSSVIVQQIYTFFWY